MVRSASHQSIFREREVPQRTPRGLRLPGGLYIQPLRDVGDIVWRLVDDAGHPHSEISALDVVLYQPSFNPSVEPRALDQLQNLPAQQQRALVYTGLVVEYLYLGPVESTPDHADQAARAARVLIQYWEDQLRAGNHLAPLALFLLRRCYWKALKRLLEHVERLDLSEDTSELPGERIQALRRLAIRKGYRWLSGWLEQLGEAYIGALRAWQQECLRDETDRFFAEWLTPWVNGIPEKRGRPLNWQTVREHEVAQIVWRHDIGDTVGAPRKWWQTNKRSVDGSGLCAPGVSTAAGQHRLDLLIEHWYLPRSDLLNATRLRWQIDGALRRNRLQRLVLLLPLGVTRLWAGAGIGYIATMLQGDTWRALFTLVTVRWGWGLGLGVGALGLAWGYLCYEVSRRAGVEVSSRAALILAKGELFALPSGLLAALIFAPVLLGTPPLPPGQLAANWYELGLMALLYAQLALAIGVFTQLIFDDKPATSPLD